jgi:hypothetical protein
MGGRNESGLAEHTIHGRAERIDAARYIKLRKIAVELGVLESVVAILQLDYMRGDPDRFDAEVDALDDNISNETEQAIRDFIGFSTGRK